MTRALAIGAAVVAMFTATAGWTQTPPKDLFKGKVKPGMYEERVEVDMSGVPGIPKDQAKSVETKQRCMTTADVERGVEESKGCVTSGFKMEGDWATYTSTCKTGNETQVTQMRIAVTNQGFKTEMKNTMKQGGQSMTSTMKSDSRYLGPCK